MLSWGWSKMPLSPQGTALLWCGFVAAWEQEPLQSSVAQPWKAVKFSIIVKKL